MKKNILLGLGLAFLAFSCGKKEEKGATLSGSVVGVDSGKVYLQKFNNKMFHSIDSTEIKNGTFEFEIDGLALPEIYGLTVDPSKSAYMIFLEDKPISVELDTASYYKKTKTSGSSLQDTFTAYKQQENVDISQFIKNNPKSLVAAYALYRDYSYRLTPKEIKENIQLLDSTLWNTPYIEVLNDLTKTLEVVAVGNKAPDFTANNPEGNPVKLSDHLGKGYVLIDFWASWCPPCRKENPNIVKVYNKYKDKGFDVFAVSLDQKKAPWLAAIEKDGLVWTQVSDLKFWDSEPAKLYGVRAIPSNVLVDKDGVIVAKNITGEELETTLNNLLK